MQLLKVKCFEIKRNSFSFFLVQNFHFVNANFLIGYNRRNRLYKKSYWLKLCNKRQKCFKLITCIHRISVKRDCVKGAVIANSICSVLKAKNVSLKTICTSTSEFIGIWIELQSNMSAEKLKCWKFKAPRKTCKIDYRFTHWLIDRYVGKTFLVCCV